MSPSASREPSPTGKAAPQHREIPHSEVKDAERERREFIRENFPPKFTSSVARISRSRENSPVPATPLSNVATVIPRPRSTPVRITPSPLHAKPPPGRTPSPDLARTRLLRYTDSQGGYSTDAYDSLSETYASITEMSPARRRVGALVKLLMTLLHRALPHMLQYFFYGIAVSVPRHVHFFLDV